VQNNLRAVSLLMQSQWRV